MFAKVLNNIAVICCITVAVLTSGCKPEIVEVVSETHPNGEKKIAMYYAKKNGVDVAVAQKSYYDNGSLEVEGNFDDSGKREGKWTYYYPNGKVWSSCEYKGGLKHGKNEVFFENGKPRYAGSFSNDKRIGEWKFWNEKGEIAQEKDFSKK